MRIFAISDLHMSIANPKPMNIFGGSWDDYLEKIKADWQERVLDEDVVIIAGDISWAMSSDDAIKDFEYFKDLKGKKIFIRGNHDYWWKGITNLRERVPENCFLLQNDAIKIQNVVFCGSRCWACPGSPDFKVQDEKIFARETERLRLAFHKAEGLREEGDKLLVITHFPPFNVRREYNQIIELIESNRADAVVYGHLHGKDSRADKLLVRNGIKYYLSSCDLVQNKLVEIEFD